MRVEIKRITASAKASLIKDPMVFQTFFILGNSLLNGLGLGVEGPLKAVGVGGLRGGVVGVVVGPDVPDVPEDDE